MAVGPQDPGGDTGSVTAQNMDSKYTRQTFSPEKGSEGSWAMDIDKTQLRWESYVKAGYHVRFSVSHRNCLLMSLICAGRPRKVLCWK